MAEENMALLEQRNFTPEAKPLESLERAVSPSPDEIKELTKGSWADDWRAIKEKLVLEQTPKDQQGRILRTEAVVAAAFPDAPESVRKIALDVLRRQLEEAEIEATDTNVSLLPLARNLGPLVKKLEAKPLEPAISETDKAKLRQFDLLDKAAKEVGIEQGISGALLELQKTQRALGATQEVVNKRVAEVLAGTQESKGLRQKVNKLSRQIDFQERTIQAQEQEIQSLKAKLEKLPAPVAPPLEKKSFAVAAENLSSNLRAVKAIDLLVHQGDLMANEKAKQADTQALLNEALAKYPDLESFKLALQKLIETRITVSKEGLSEEEFRQAEKLKREEYHQEVASLLTDLERVYELKSAPAAKEILADQLLEKRGNINWIEYNPAKRPEARIEEEKTLGSFRISAGSDRGEVRDLDEDFYIMERIQDFNENLLIVADGVGGHSAGDKASRLASKALRDSYLKQKRWLEDQLGAELKKSGRKLNTEESQKESLRITQQALKNAVEAANITVINFNKQEKTDSGTTCVAAVLNDNGKYIVANVGDSRAYRIDDQKAEKITTDHSLVERLVATNQIKREETYTHPQRNIIYRGLGNNPTVEVDIFTGQIEKGEQLLLCCDGLWEMTKDIDGSVIHQFTRSVDNQQEVTRRLIAKANQEGGEDNITVVVAKRIQ